MSRKFLVQFLAIMLVAGFGLTQAPIRVAAAGSAAASSDGSTPIATGTDANFVSGNGAWTATVVATTTVGAQMLMTWGANYQTGVNIAETWNGGIGEWVGGNFTQNYAGVNVMDGNPHLYEFTYDGAVLRTYVDGNYAFSFTVSPNVSLTGTAYLGSGGNTQGVNSGWNGSMSDFAYFHGVQPIISLSTLATDGGLESAIMADNPSLFLELNDPNLSSAADDSVTATNFTYGSSVVQVAGPVKDTDEANVGAASLAITPSSQYTATGSQATVVATARNASGNPVAGVSVVFNVAGANAASGVVTTGANGQAQFSYLGLDGGIDTVRAFADNNGDGIAGIGEPTASATVLWYGTIAHGGAFVIGDKEAVLGRSVTFWNSTWAATNALSEGTAPSSFKGFADVGTASCGSSGPTASRFSTGPGNSASPPTTVPTYIAVLVTSKSSKVGSAITGSEVHVAIILTNTGYADSPGHPGTGTVVAIGC